MAEAAVDSLPEGGACVKQEQKELRRLYESDEAEMVVVYGRRRVGKTYLVRETFSERLAFQESERVPFATVN